MSDDPKPSPRATRWLARLLRVLPSGFRDKHGASIEQLVRDQLRDARSTHARRAVWTSTVKDLLSIAPREHLRALLHDQKVAMRVMRKNALVTTVVLCTLAIGIGANVTLFSVVNTVSLRPLPFQEGDRLVRIYGTRDGGPPFLSPSNPELYDRIVEDGRFFKDIVAQRFTDVSLGTDRGPERVAAMAVTAGWARTLGIEPLVGRVFTPEEEQLGLAAGVALVSHGFWQRHLGGVRETLGRDIRVDEREVTVVGVLPKGFQYPYENDLWIPLNLDRDRDGVWGLNIQARLEDGVSVEATRSELLVIAERVNETRPTLLNGMRLTAIPTREVLLGDDRGFVVVLLGAVGFLLLLVSVNIGNLLLARAVSRMNETALRTALGASRARQFREVLTESVTLSLIGGVLGTALAFGLQGFAGQLVPGRMANLMDGISMDLRVLGFALAISIVTGLLFGAVPAMRATGSGLVDILKQGRATGRRPRLSEALVIAEIALTLTILAGASVLARHYRELASAELGYDGSKILLASVPLDDGAYAEDGDKRVALIREATERLGAIPGVTHVGAAALFPSLRGNQVTEVSVDGRPVDPEAPMVLNHRLVTPEFFDAVGIPLVRGRALSASDVAGSPGVAVISERGARRYFSGEDPIGRRIRNVRAETADWITIVGIVADVREFYDIQETWYLPYAQHADERVAGQAVFTLRSEARDTRFEALIREAMLDVDPSRPVFDVESIDELYWESLGEQRLGAMLSTAFAGFGVLMAALGVGGVMAYSVRQRFHELGLRVALGARPADLLRVTLGAATRWTSIGIAVGLVGTYFLTRFLGSVVPDVAPPDVFDVLVVSTLLAAVALLASYFPARQALRIDPLRALRDE